MHLGKKFLIIIIFSLSQNILFANDFNSLKGKKIFNRFDDMKNIASNRLEDWLEEDEDINQNLDFKQKSFYYDDESTRSFSDKKEDDPWI